MATSANLLKLFWDQDVEGFTRVLATATTSLGSGSLVPESYGKDSYLGSSFLGRSPTSLKTSKPRKGQSKNQGLAVSKAEINFRDHAGLTLLLRATASTHPSAIRFTRALLQHPAIDLYAQDTENGWNALHRALYAGNISIARLLLVTEQKMLHNDLLGTSGRVGSLIKTKDREGNSPFDLYHKTISVREITRDLQILSRSQAQIHYDSNSEPEDNSDEDDDVSRNKQPEASNRIFGDELFMFGSNKNNSLGVGDGDDRQYPERIQLSRPENIIEHFHRKYLETVDPISEPAKSKGKEVPQIIRSKPIVIRDVVLSKFHSAILTEDPFANLYISGVGRGGRLGLGDENTQFRFVPLQGPLSEASIVKVALGQNHTMAVTSTGELWTWGSNTCSQLGYVLPSLPKPDDEPMSLFPRQVFSTLKKESVIGAAASAIHSVAYTSTSLYCWGSNQGQLALMDSDSRSLTFQTVPRKVAASLFSAPIKMVTASEKATICLLQNHTVVIFTNYGYNIVNFPAIDVMAGFGVQTNNSNRTRNKRKHGQTTKVDFVSSSGDTVAALTVSGEVYVINVAGTGANSSTASTTNPAKIRCSVSTPQRIWHARKDAATSVGVGENGSVILSTESGAVWRRVERDPFKEKNRKNDGKRDAFKFQRVPTMTGAVAVRGSPFGAFAVVRSDTKVTKDLISVRPQSLWEDVGALFPLRNFTAMKVFTSTDAVGVLKGMVERADMPPFVQQVLKSADIEADLKRFLSASSFDDTLYDAILWTSSAPELKIPAHSWLLAARSRTFRACISKAIKGEAVDVPEFFSIRRHNLKMEIEFQNLDIYGLINLITIAYTDSVVPTWNYTRLAPYMAHRYRQVRVEIMKLASKLNMATLEGAARSQIQARISMNVDFRTAIHDSRFYDSGNVLLKLSGKDVLVHRDMIYQRCPMFRGLFHGHSNGAWLKPRLQGLEPGSPIVVDLSHIDARAFEYVLEHLYADVGTELFDELATADLDEFGELVHSVMEIANELMIDRLIEICQSVLGRFVTMRNVASILNKVDMTYISSFKTASLEYVCLQLEGFLENHLLDHMDDALLEELDNVVRQNQLAAQPFARSNQLENLLLIDENLKADIEEEHKIRCRELVWKTLQKGDLTTALKARRESLDAPVGLSPFAKGSRKKGKEDSRDQSSQQHTPKLVMSPELHAEDDGMMFQMDMEPLTPTPQVRSRDASEALSSSVYPSGKGKTKKLNLKREQLTWDWSGKGSGSSAPAAPWASQQQSALDSQITMVTEAMEDAALDDDAGWQSVSKNKGRKPSISGSPAMDHFYSGSPSFDRDPRSTINIPAATVTATAKTSTRRPSTSMQSSSSMQSPPSRSFNLGSLLPGATPPTDHKLTMKIPPPPTAPPPSLSAIFDEQQEERQRQKDQEQVRNRPLHEIQAEQQFEQWWVEEQLRMKQREEDDKRSEQLIHSLLAQEHAYLSNNGGGDSSGGTSRATTGGGGGGKGKARAIGNSKSGAKAPKSKDSVYPSARSWAETTSFIPGQLAHEQFGVATSSSPVFAPFPRPSPQQRPKQQKQKHKQKQKQHAHAPPPNAGDSSSTGGGGGGSGGAVADTVAAATIDSQKQPGASSKKAHKPNRGGGSGGASNQPQQLQKQHRQQQQKNKKGDSSATLGSGRGETPFHPPPPVNASASSASAPVVGNASGSTSGGPPAKEKGKEREKNKTKPKARGPDFTALTTKTKTNK